MKQLSSYDYIKLNIADAMGVKVNSWEESISQVDRPIAELKANPLMDTNPEYYRAVTALEEAYNTGRTAYMCSLDQGASVIGHGGLLTNDPKCLFLGNLIRDPSKPDSPRVHAYREIEKHMGLKNVEYDPLKEAIMQSLYGGYGRAIEVFGSVDTFQRVAQEQIPGAWEFRQAAISLHRPDQTHYSFYQLDGVKIILSDKIKARRRIVSTASGKEHRIEMECQIEGIKERQLSLAANIIHSFDGYIVRRMYKRMAAEGMAMRAIHDSFYCHPAHMNRLREILKEELITLYKSNYLSQVFRQITGNKFTHAPRISNIDLTEYLENMEYHIC